MKRILRTSDHRFKRTVSMRGALTALPLLLVTGLPATAQEAPATPVPVQNYTPEIPRGSTVVDRPRPEVDPLGIRAGAFLVFPSITLEQGYDSNVTASGTDDQEDFVTVVAPRVEAVSQWSLHELRLATGASIGRYWDFDGEDYEDWFIRGRGTYEISRRNLVQATLDHQNLHEGREDPEVLAGQTATDYTVDQARLRYRHEFGRFAADATGSIALYDYEETAGADDRDRTVTSLTVRGSYEVQPNYDAFVQLGGNIRDRDSGAIDRSSTGWQAAAGIALDLGGVTFGEAFLGWRQQNYEDPTLPTVDGLAYGLKLTSNVTTLTTLTAEAETSVEETTLTTASGYSANRFGLTADHELLRNLLLHAGLGYTLYDYEGIDREINVTSIGLGATYLMNRYVHIAPRYEFTDHDESGADSSTSWDRSLFLVRLKLQL